MEIQKQFYNFYKPYLKRVSEAIKNGKSLILVGINSIGKTLLVGQILSNNFREDYLSKTKVHLVHLEFKDKNPPTTEQLYKYWLIQTAKALNKTLPSDKESYNDFSFYSHLLDMVKSLSEEEKLTFILLDAQNILSQGEAFFKSLIYLHTYSYGRLSFIILSEPQILDSHNIWVQNFIQYLTNFKFIFLKTFDRKTALADIHNQETIYNKSFKKHYSLLLKYSRGLHGVIRAFCNILKKNPHISNVRPLMKIAYSDRLCEYWVKKVLESLPKECFRILKEVADKREKFNRYRKSVFTQWLIDLSFLKKNGVLRYPLILPLLEQYVIKNIEKNPTLRMVKNQFYGDGERIMLAKKEKKVLQLLHKWKGKLVTYDAIGEVLWKEEPEKFSLWAISQIIRRIRKKLVFYFNNQQIIKSRRGKGYIFEL